MKPDIRDGFALVGFVAMTAGLYLLWGAPVALLVDGILLIGIALRK